MNTIKISKDTLIKVLKALKELQDWSDEYEKLNNDIDENGTDDEYDAFYNARDCFADTYGNADWNDLISEIEGAIND